MVSVTHASDVQNSNRDNVFKYTEMFLRINQSMMSITTEQELLDHIMDEIYDVFDHHDCGCILVNRDGLLYMESQVGYTAEAMRSFNIKVEESYFYRYAGGEYNRVYRINQIDLINEEDYSKVAESVDGTEMLSSISAPIIIDDKLYGLINFDSPYENAFTEEQLVVMEYVRIQLAAAIKNMKLYEKIIHLSRYDQLTALCNRHYFETIIEELILNCMDSSSEITLVVCDVDYLKKVNDTWGHLAGDEYLKLVAKCLKESLPECSHIGRFGGDEFIAVISDIEDQELVERLSSAQLNLDSCDDIKWNMSFSYGFSKLIKGEDTYLSVLKKADEKMYLQKSKRIFGRRKNDR